MDAGRQYSTGEVARLLGVTRDSLIGAMRYGAPEPEAARVGGRRVFGEADVARLQAWYESRGRRVLA